MNKFPLQNQHWGVLTPCRAIDSDELDDSTEAGYLEMLQQGLQSVLEMLEQDRRHYQLRMAQKYQILQEKLQEKEQMHSDLVAVCGDLKVENEQLKLNLEQMVRFAKRYELKQQLLDNKINHLAQQLSEKEAVIRYLEAKTHTAPTPNTSKHMLSSLTFQQMNDESTFKSISQLPCPSNKNIADIKFEDFKVVLRRDGQAGGGAEGKARRNRTESNENENGENVSWMGGNGKLGELLSARVWGRREEERGQVKKYPSNCDYSFWKYGSKQPARTHRSSSGMLNSTSFLQSRRQNASFSREYGRGT